MSEIIDTNLITVLPRRRGHPLIVDGRRFEDISHDEQVERWERVRHVLRSMSQHQIDKHFDMADWLQVNDCGTVGCAAGHCSLDPWFNRRGFSAVLYDGKYFKGFTMNSSDFFGNDGCQAVFVDRHCQYYINLDGDTIYRKPRAQHRMTLRNVNQYLKQLKAQL